jgi:hypothetical protein
MNLRRFGALGTALAAAVFVGCEQSPAEKVQEEREDVVEAQQNLREQQAEASDAERAARNEQPGDGGGPILTLPAPETTDSAAPLSDESEDVTAPSTPAENDAGNTTEATDRSAAEPPDQPNEGDPQAGTQEGGT